MSTTTVTRPGRSPDGRRRAAGPRPVGPFVVACALLLVVIRAFVVEPMTVLSSSMEPTLRAGDRVLVDRVAWRATGLSTGDLVVFPSPQDGALTLKRVVAVGGQEVEIRDAVLHVDGQAVDEPHADSSRVDGLWFGPAPVPPGTVFVLGDARSGSQDSRVFGPLPVADVHGRALPGTWPFGG